MNQPDASVILQLSSCQLRVWLPLNNQDEDSVILLELKLLL